MADASCSGANPFKRLVDQQNRDVSHQQDRLRNSPAAHGPGEFRSAQQPSQAQDGFASFVDGPSAMPHDPAGRLAAHVAALDPAHASHFRPAPHAQAQPHPFSQTQASSASGVNNWAADFQSFSRAQASFAPQANQQPPSQLNFQAAFGQAGQAFSPMQNHTMMTGTNGFPAMQPATQSDFDQEMNRWMKSYGNGTAVNGAGMQEVDAMMDQVARELELNEGALAAAEDIKSAETHDTSTARFTDLETPEIANLSLESENELKQEQPDPVQSEAALNKSAVSEAAKQLLESVQHEDGEKWKNSTFLSLMRDFRDGKKDIVDNEIRQMEPSQDEATASKHAN